MRVEVATRDQHQSAGYAVAGMGREVTSMTPQSGTAWASNGPEGFAGSAVLRFTAGRPSMKRELPLEAGPVPEQDRLTGLSGKREGLRPYSRGSVTPRWPMYLPARSA